MTAMGRYGHWTQPQEIVPTGPAKITLEPAAIHHYFGQPLKRSHEGRDRRHFSGGWVCE
jgi:hypothetical protein